MAQGPVQPRLRLGAGAGTADDPDRACSTGRRPTRGASPTRHPRTSPARSSSGRCSTASRAATPTCPAQFDQAAYDRLTPGLFDQADRAGAVTVAAGADLPAGLGRARQALRRRGGRPDDDLRPGDAARPRRRRHLPGHDAGAHARRGNRGQRQLPRDPLDLRARRTRRRWSPTWRCRRSSRSPRPTRPPGASSRSWTPHCCRRPSGQRFDALPSSPVVPAYDVLSRNANPELAAPWVPAIDQGWRRAVLGASS